MLDSNPKDELMIAGSAGVRHRKRLRVCECPVKSASRVAIYLGTFRFRSHSVMLAGLVDGNRLAALSR